jgi:hypothetical protein
MPPYEPSFPRKRDPVLRSASGGSGFATVSVRTERPVFWLARFLGDDIRRRPASRFETRNDEAAKPCGGPPYRLIRLLFQRRLAIS